MRGLKGRVWRCKMDYQLGAALRELGFDPLTLTDYELSVLASTKMLLEAVNGMMPKRTSSLMFAVLNQGHRTLQQAVWRTFVELAKVYGEQSGSDGRNEASVEFCKQITTMVEDGVLPYLPVI